MSSTRMFGIGPRLRDPASYPLVSNGSRLWPTVVKLSVRRCGVIYPSFAAPTSSNVFLGLGPRLVAMTLGALGLRCLPNVLSRRFVSRYPARPGQPVVDPVGRATASGGPR